MSAVETDTETDERTITITDRAHAQILELRAVEDDGDGLGLRIEVTGVKGADFTYDLAFEPVAEAADDDHRFDDRGLTVVIPAESVPNLRGATLDLPSASSQGGLVLRNPNRPSTPQLGAPMDLKGTTEEKVRQLLAEQVNPALAAHGGFASLIRIEGSAAHISMGGGCQGCAVSAMTLRDGIEAAILANIPEITEVVDTTDHDAGENPFYS
ncbi:MAG: NifU family protein [Acidimicrobiia bacterium]|nr:NifU family protein [Acidimicrobiia bacterium]